MKEDQPVPWKEIERWETDVRDDFEERAGIMEFDGNLPRRHAEWEAYKLIKGKLALYEQRRATN